MSRNRRTDGFHGGTSLARHRAAGAATQIHRELNHGETGKGDSFLRWEHALAGLAQSWWFGGLYRGGLDPIRGVLKSWCFAWGGRPKQRPLLDRHTHTRRGTV